MVFTCNMNITLVYSESERGIIPNFNLALEIRDDEFFTSRENVENLLTNFSEYFSL